MENCVSKDHNITSKDIRSRDALKVGIRTRFCTATSAVTTAKFNHPMSFNEFYKLVDDIIRERQVTLKSAYANCPTVVHDYLSLKAAKQGYQEFKEGQLNDEEIINPKISSAVLWSLYNARPFPKVISDEFDTEDSDKIDLYSLHTYIHKYMEKLSVDFARIYRHTAAEVRDEYPLPKAKNDSKKYLAGKQVKGTISFDAAESILHVIQSFQLYERLTARKTEEISKSSKVIAPVGIPVVNNQKEEAADRLERNSTVLKEYREKFNALRDAKQVPLAAVWRVLPYGLVKGHSYLSYRNASCLGSDRNNLSIDVCNAILDVYQKLPNYTDPVRADEVNGYFALGDNFGLMASSEVAYAQIKEAQKYFGTKREAIISKFSELTGRPEDSRLLVKKHGRDKYISRLQVAIIMNIIEGKDVPKEAVTLLNHYLDNSKLIEPSDKRVPPSSGLMFHEDGRLVLGNETPLSSESLVKEFEGKVTSVKQDDTMPSGMVTTFNCQNNKPRPAGYCSVSKTSDIQCDTLALG